MKESTKLVQELITLSIQFVGGGKENNEITVERLVDKVRGSMGRFLTSRYLALI